MSDARSVGDLGGIAETFSLDLSLTIVPIKGSLEHSQGIGTWATSITVGPGVGAAFTRLLTESTILWASDGSHQQPKK